MKATAETYKLLHSMGTESYTKFYTFFVSFVNQGDYKSIMNSMSKDELRTLIKILESLE